MATQETKRLSVHDLVEFLRQFPNFRKCSKEMLFNNFLASSTINATVVVSEGDKTVAVYSWIPVGEDTIYLTQIGVLGGLKKYPGEVLWFKDNVLKDKKLLAHRPDGKFTDVTKQFNRLCERIRNGKQS